MRTLADIADMVTEWQNALGLGQWQIRISDARPYGTRTFRVEHLRQYREVQFRVYPCALTMAADRCWRLVGHEMLHVLFFPVEEALGEDIGEGQVYDRWHNAEEAAVDGLSVRLVELFPMPGKYAEALAN